MRPALFLAVCLIALPALAQRPSLSGPEEVHASPDGHLLIHFTRTGADAVRVGDVDPLNGVPDEVDDVEGGMGHAWDAFVTTDGWPAPPVDEGRSGDDRLDVFIRDIPAFGYTNYEATASGRYTSYFEIDPGNSSMGRALARSIAAHELHHALQAGVTVWVDPWIFEATSTWAQYTLYGEADLQLVRNLSWALRLQGAHKGLADTGDRFEYAGMTWVQFLLDRQNSPRPALLTLWQDMAAVHDWEAGHRTFLAPTTLEDAVAEYAVWNLFACTHDDGRHYSAAMPCTLDVEVPTSRVTPPASGQTVEVGRFGAAYLEFPQDCTSDVLAVQVSAPTSFAVRLVRVRAAGESPVEAPTSAGGLSSLEVPGWNDEARTVVAVVNLGAAPASFSWQAETRGTYAPAPLASAARRLSVTPEALEPLKVRDTVALEAKGHFGSCANGTVVTAHLVWHTSDPAVAQVADGVVLAVSPGSSEVFATNGTAESNHVTVTVEPGACGCTGASQGPWLLAALALAAVRRRSRAPGRR